MALAIYHVLSSGIVLQPQPPTQPHHIAVILKGYPRLSETFIAQELRELEKRNFKLTIYSLRHPYDPATHPIHQEIVANIVYLPEYLHLEKSRVWRALGNLSRRPQLWWPLLRTGGKILLDFSRDRSRNRLRRFGQGLTLAAEIDPSCILLYSHFMHTPASVARYASSIIGLPFSISAHAKDIWTIENWEKKQKLADSRWLVTCTRANHQHLQSLATEPSRVHLLYHGLDLSRFAPANAIANPDQPRNHTLQIISVGRMVEKKGYRYLLDALAGLPQHFNWHFTHIGGGPLQAQLQQQARNHHLNDRISWLGALPQQQVLQQFRRADLFVLPSIVGDDGDRDGLPNVLMEAQSQRLACLSTDISGIPELIEHRHNGWLVPQRNSDALKNALVTLLQDDPLRTQLGENGYQNVHTQFSHVSWIGKLEQLLKTCV